jgi:hypothetical protein
MQPENMRVVVAFGALFLSIPLLLATPALSEQGRTGKGGSAKPVPAATPALGTRDTAACRAENEKLKAAVGRVKFEIAGPSSRPITEPLVIRVSGIRTLTPDIFSVVKPVVAFKGSILVETARDGWSITRAGEPDGDRAYAQDQKRLSYAPLTSAQAVPDSAEVIVSSNSTGPVEVTAAMVAKTNCGERLIGEVTTQVVMFVPDPRDAELAGSGRDACGKEGQLLKRLASQVTVTIEGKPSVKAGEAVQVSWKRGSERFLARRPAHIVLTMPEWVRFEGSHMLPLPAGARTPSGINYGGGQMRVFIPLSTRSVPEQGAFKIQAYRTGPLTIGHAVVVKTACGETILSQGTPVTIEVEPGEAEVVIQDFFSLDRPESVVISNDGRYRLEIFKASYRVFETASGIKIVDRAGVNPNFSPAARFVVAYESGNESVGGALEVVDLITRKPVPRLTLHGPIVAWALNDALLIEGTMGHPDLRVRRSLVNPTFVKPFPSEPDREEEVGLIDAGTSGRGTSAWERFRPKLLLDQGLVVIETHSPPEAKPHDTVIYELASGRKLGAHDRPDGTDQIVDHWSNHDRALEPEDIRKLLATYGLETFSTAPGWDTGEPLTLSHFSPSVDDRLPELAETRQDGTKAPGPAFPRQRTYFVQHQRKLLDATTHVASNTFTSARGTLDWRTRAVIPRAANVNANDATRFSQQLALHGICFRPGCRTDSKVEVPPSLVKKSEFPQWTFQYSSQKTTFTTSAEAIEKALVRDIPAAKKLLAVKPNRVCYQGEPAEGAGAEENVKFRVIADKEGNTDVHGVWNWSIGDRKFWLVQTVCAHAGILGSPVVLFAGSKGSPGKIYVLAHGDAAGEADGLHKDFQGVPSESVVRVRPFIVDDWWLLIAAPAGRAAAIVDLQNPSKASFVHGLHDAYAIANIFRSADGKHLVQLNTDGRFHIFKADNGDFVISGRWIDDELVLVTSHGYYSGSYEGAHFVHLSFAGEPEIYSLAQFEKVLRRPDIIKSVLEGTTKDGPRPALAVPPRVDLQIANDGRSESAKLRPKAPAGLKTVRLFEDGQPIKEVGITGQEAETTVPLDPPLSGHWLTAIAEDEAGFLSAPSTVAVTSPHSHQRKLHAVLVGIDKYQEPRFKLNFASSDAARLAKALRSQRGGYYSSVEIAELLDDAATSDAIVGALESAIARARPGDTVLFAFAGHGLRGSDGHYYLTASGFRSADPAGTGLAWSRLSRAIERSQVRVIVVLDSCHAGTTGLEGIVTNDQAADELLKGSRAPVLVLAASKGRQFSYEDKPGAPPKWGGGVFTYALAEALTGNWRKTDTNDNGALEISELYRAVKALVVKETEGKQTPWIARQDLIGDFALF